MKRETLIVGIIVILLAMASYLDHSVHAQSIGTWGSTGQQAVTGSAVALPSLQAKAVCIKAAVANSITVYLGNTANVTTSTGYPLEAGLSVCVPATNVNQVYVIASTTGANVGFFATAN